jgi:hypothetical protein
MLDLMLGNASDAFSCGEVSAWFRPWRTHHFKIDCPCGQDPCPVWKKIKSVPESQFLTTVIREMNVNYVIDSSKDLCWLIDMQKWAVADNIRTVNLVLWKNPIDLAYSFWKRGNGLIYWRKVFVKQHRRFFEIGLPFLAINYRDIVSNPQSKVEEICNAIGMPFFEGKERFWDKEHHHLFGSSGVRKQVVNGESIINSNEDFPREFEESIDYLRQQVVTDHEVQQIMEILRKADVSSFNDESSVNQRYTIKAPYPLWYYVKRIKRLKLRYLPERFEIQAN